MFIIRHDEILCANFGLHCRKNINVQNDKVQKVKIFFFFPVNFHVQQLMTLLRPSNHLGPLYFITKSQDKISNQRQAIMTEVRYGFLSLPRQMPG